MTGRSRSLLDCMTDYGDARAEAACLAGSPARASATAGVERALWRVQRRINRLEWLARA